jgi:hypothetical protein
MSDTTAPASIPPIALSKPVNVLGTPTGTLTLREPTGNDLSEAGYPTRFDARGNAMIDAPAMTKLIARLAGVPDTAIREMAARDWNKAALLVASFLGDGAGSISS